VVHFGANDTIIAENHFVNIDTLVAGGSQSTPNGKGKFIINLWKSTAASTTRSSMCFARKKSIKILPNSDVTFSKDCNFSPSDIVRPISVLGMTGHYHSRGKRFWVDKMKGFYDANGNKTGDTLLQANVYQSIAWDEPPFTVYDPPVLLNTGEFLRMSAEYVNNSANTFLFGPHVKTDEHFNLFTWFAPSWHNGQTLYDDNE
ncbi:MAG: hypothetical protein Q8916_01115, partial [Bacteroidota bacterium]|nr:hypothetical protein [Bacteroidota bacterium]